MNEALEVTIEFPSSYRSSTSKPVRRKNRSSAEPELGDMFLGVGELTPQDEGLVSQRSETDDRRSGSNVPSTQRQRSRVRQSSGPGSTKRKTLSGPEPKQDAAPSSLLVPGEELFQRDNMVLARQQLTSSASRVRPGKHQSNRSTVPPSRVVSDQPNELLDDNHHNNNDDNDEPIVEQAGGRSVQSNHFIRGRAEWENVHPAGRLSTRSRRYYEGSDDLAPGNEFSRQDPDEGQIDRPPSRQRHAFPTHLLDPREFFSPNKHHDGASGVNITPWHADDDDRQDDEAISPVASGPEEDTDIIQPNHGFTNQRPPSRYMVKPARGTTSSSDTSSSSRGDDGQGRLPSRRGAAGSRNQAAIQCYHDPKTDGFLEVDESVPPPFRVEISTDSNHTQYVASQHRRMDEERRHGLKSRRSSSFGTRSQLKNLQQQTSTGVIERDSPLLQDTEATTRNRHLDPQWFQELEPSTKNRVDRTQTTRHTGATRSRSIVQPTASFGTESDNNTANQWFRSINNPFFISPPASTGPALSSLYDDMDAETAIANTPLFADKDDLVSMTQLSDLHLDDFMGDPYVYSSTSMGTSKGLNNPISVAGVSMNATATTTASASLNTSLGRDFLSLFAQH